MAESRAISKLEERIDRYKAQLASSREKLKKGGELVIETAEISAAAGAAGFVRGRFPDKVDFGPNKQVPFELVAYAGLQAMAYNDPANETHFRRAANGISAGYTYHRMMEWGREAKAKADQKAPPALPKT